MRTNLFIPSCFGLPIRNLSPADSCHRYSDVLKKLYTGKCTHAAYHYAVRAAKKNKNMITRQRFADAVLDADHRNFWSDIKRIRSSKSGVAGIVDGHTDVDRYSCVSYNRSDMQHILDDV